MRHGKNGRRFDMGTAQRRAMFRNLTTAVLEHGYVRTFQNDPDKREDGRVVVIVAVIRSNPGEDARIRDRSDLLMREAWNHHPGD